MSNKNSGLIRDTVKRILRMHHDLLLGQISLLSWLLANGGDGSIADGAGDLAIHYAAIGDQPLAILTLADKGI